MVAVGRLPGTIVDGRRHAPEPAEDRTELSAQAPPS